VVRNGVSVATVTDVLNVSYTEQGFDSGSLVIMLQNGTIIDGTFTANMPQVRVDVSSDGSYRTSDGRSGTFPNWKAALASLRAPLDGLLLSAGLASGKII
jgi:hypothetical protein